jgi:putative ABC transport system permease protein
MREILSRFRLLLTRRPSRELDDEIAFHIEQAEAAERAAGHSPEEARRRARIAFGGVERTREQSWEQRPGWWLEMVGQDARYALRGLRCNLVFTVAVVVTLALGIGATTAVFSVVDRILFRPLPYAHDDRLVSVGLVQSLERQEFMLGGFFYDWRDSQRPFEAFAAQGTMLHACNLVENHPLQLGCINAQVGFLPLLGVSPMLGRNFLPEEDRPNGPRVALISYSLWKTHYGGDRSILDRLINLDGDSFRVVGVLPKDFELPTLQIADVMTPMALDEAAQRKMDVGRPMRTFARLKPGVSIAQAKEQMEPLFEHTEQTLIPPPIRKDFRLSIRSVRDRETADVQRMSWILLGGVLAVLLIACANVAGLMMARAAARERELAVRSALGASRTRLVRQTLIEALLLAMMGFAAGAVLAEGMLRVFLAMAPTGIPFLYRAQLDLRILAAMFVLSLGCGVIFGLAPALEKPRTMALTARGAYEARRTLLRRILVAGQIAVSLTLLSCSALLLRSFRNIEEQRLGMEPDRVLMVRLAMPGFRYNSDEKKMRFYLDAEAAVRRIPGVEALGWSDSFPPGGWHGGRRFSEFAVEGRPKPEGSSGGSIVDRKVTPDYFRALNIPIVRGRNFTEEERGETEQKMIVSRLMASRLFPGEDPIGRRVQLSFSGGGWFTVVGVAENVKNGGLTTQDDPEVYTLIRNTAGEWNGPMIVGEEMGGGAPMMSVALHADPKLAGAWVKAQIASLDPMVVTEVEPMAQRMSRMADRPRFATSLVGFFAMTGLLMAAVGLYGVISFMATRRTQEIGVRMALGARRGDILRLVTWEGGRLILLGGVVGVATALAVTRLLKGMLFGVAPGDPVSLVAVVVVLAGVALGATLIPARRAMKTDPMEALRYE